MFRKKSKKTLRYVLLCLSLLWLPHSVWAAGAVFEGYVVKVLDGDSLLVRSGSKTREVRLWGIDCPEYRQPYAEKARQLSKKLVLKKKVKVQVQGKDRYSRYLGIVSQNGVNLNYQLVKSGAAWVYRKYCSKAVCKRWKSAEKKAQRNKIGLWRKGKAIPPWTWRHRKH